MTTLEATASLLKGLSEEELQAIQVVARAFHAKQKRDRIPADDLLKDYYAPMTEEQLFNRIDEGVSQLKRGEGRDARDVGKELREKLGL